MEDGLPVFEGADIAENVGQHPGGGPAILAHPVAPVGIGAYGDDLAPQLLESLEEVHRGKIPLDVITIP